MKFWMVNEIIWKFNDKSVWMKLKVNIYRNSTGLEIKALDLKLKKLENLAHWKIFVLEKEKKKKKIHEISKKYSTNIDQVSAKIHEISAKIHEISTNFYSCYQNIGKIIYWHRSYIVKFCEKRSYPLISLSDMRF